MPYIIENPLSAQLPAHFNLSQPEAYQQWRQRKLADYPHTLQTLSVSLQNPWALSTKELATLDTVLARTNLAIYKCEGAKLNKEALQRLTSQLGLSQLDANLCADEDQMTSLQVRQTGRHGGYIPYSNKRLSWHTDGYYNPPEQQVRAIVLHCVRPAYEGGENQFLDPEILYIQLRDQNPDWIAALQHPDAMLIPPNIENGKEIRGETRGSVFSVLPSGHLHMRYSARARNIEWRQDAHIKAATEFITEFLRSDSVYIFRYRLAANEGVISNNVLHNRTAFIDKTGAERLLYRARFYQRACIEKENT